MKAVNKFNLMIFVVVMLISLTGCSNEKFGNKNKNVNKNEDIKAAQKKMAKKARQDAAKILRNIGILQYKFNKMAASFKIPPSTMKEWKNNFKPVKFSPNLNILGRSNLTWIPNLKQRKNFMSNLVTYYSNIITINILYNRLVNDIQSEFKKHGKLFEDIDKIKGKNISRKLRNFMGKTIKNRKAKIKKNKGVKFLVLMEGSPAKSVILPFDETNLACPSKPKNCPCKKGSKPTKTKDCKRVCPKNCHAYQKLYKYHGREYLLNTGINKNLKLKESFVAIKFEEIAPRSLNMIVKYEIRSPILEFFKNIRGKFVFIQKMIKNTEKIAPELINTLKAGKNRKEIDIKSFF